MFDCKPSQGLSFQALVLNYENNTEADINTDFDKVFGITRQNNNSSNDEEKNSTKNVIDPKEAASCGILQPSNNLQDEKNKDTVDPMTLSVNSHHEKKLSIIDLLNAGEDPIIKPYAKEANDNHESLSSVMGMIIKQIPSKHIFQDMLMSNGQEDMISVNNSLDLTVEKKAFSSSPENGHVLVAESSSVGNRTMPISVTPMESHKEEEEEEKGERLQSSLVSINDEMVQSVSKTGDQATFGTGRTGYTDLHFKEKNAGDECSCLCAIT
jgi:hypothetical protein